MLLVWPKYNPWGGASCGVTRASHQGSAVDRQNTVRGETCVLRNVPFLFFLPLSHHHCHALPRRLQPTEEPLSITASMYTASGKFPLPTESLEVRSWVWPLLHQGNVKVHRQWKGSSKAFWDFSKNITRKVQVKFALPSLCRPNLPKFSVLRKLSAISLAPDRVKTGEQNFLVMCGMAWCGEWRGRRGADPTAIHLCIEPSKRTPGNLVTLASFMTYKQVKIDFKESQVPKREGPSGLLRVITENNFPTKVMSGWQCRRSCPFPSQYCTSSTVFCVLCAVTCFSPQR